MFLYYLGKIVFLQKVQNYSKLQTLLKLWPFLVYDMDLYKYQGILNSSFRHTKSWDVFKWTKMFQ